MSKTKKNKAPKRSFLSKLILIFSIFFIFCFLLLSGFLFAFGSFDPNFQLPTLQAKDSFVASKYVWNVVAAANKSKSPQELKTIKIAQDDLASLIRFAENGGSFLEIIGVKTPLPKSDFYRYRFGYNGSKINFIYQLTKPVIGICFLASGKISAEFDNNELSVNLSELKIGRVELPSAVRQKVVALALDEVKKQRDYATFCKIVEKININDTGDIVIVYHPYELKQLMRRF